VTTVKRGMQRFIFQCGIKGLVALRVEMKVKTTEGKMEDAVQAADRWLNLRQWMLNRWRGSTGIHIKGGG
jgi:hypothetical protein